MKYYVIKLKTSGMIVPEYWTGGVTWGTDRHKACRFSTRELARKHAVHMNWIDGMYGLGAVDIVEMDDADDHEFDVKIVRTEVTEHTVRVQAKDETEAKQIVYEKDCRDEFASVWEEADCSVETEYYPTEVLDGEDN